MSAEMFSSALNSLNAKIKIGISATPKRKDGKHVFLADYFSPFMVEARDPRKLQDPVVMIKRTDFRFPVIDPKRDWSRQLNKLCSNKDYLTAIAKFAESQIVTGRCPLILGERVQMLKDLQEIIPESVCLIGESDESTRETFFKMLEGIQMRALDETFDEGISCLSLIPYILPVLLIILLSLNSA